MASIYPFCQPRADLITGSFNPEIFTASLSSVLEFYKGGTTAANAVYTDASVFFGEATYPTHGMRQVIGDVYRRLSGDLTTPAVHRLETGFGGGKTHTLIGLTHIAKRGNTLAGISDGVLMPELLPEPNEIIVVGVVGDELPVQEVKGSRIQPYTLWGEIAYQIGGEPLYRSLESEATSLSSPGKEFMRDVFSGRKVLVMLDEMAQYATRLEAARANGSEQLQAFLMGLLNYAQANPALSVVITLSSAADAFARQAKTLKDLVGKVSGKDVSESEALALAYKAADGTNSVVARAATTVVPVAAAEMSRLLSRRLFSAIDASAADATARRYAETYQGSSSYLPGVALTENYVEIIRDYYPFHPTFIEFLNQKLASVENFQGTRGVLRMLALVIRNLWEKRPPIPLIQTGDIDLKDERILNELFGRTGTSDLQVVVNTDIGGPGTFELLSGYSRSELCDQANPHPAGLALHAKVWRTVFLHSLAGRSEGLSSNLFGITSQDALLACITPEMTGAQIEMALQSIETIGGKAFYLRERDGRYYASLDPSIPRALDSIRGGIKDEQASEYIAGLIRSSIKDGSGLFRVAHDVFEPGHLEDKPGQPQLAVIGIGTDSLDIEKMVTEASAGPRRHQNLVFLLLPQTTKALQEGPWNEQKTQRVGLDMEKLVGIAKQVIAMRRLAEHPGAYGLTDRHLEAEDFKRQKSERENSLVNEIVRFYSSLWYPSASGSLARKEVRTGSGESGAALFNKIREILKADGELVTEEDALTQEKMLQFGKIFFDAVDAVRIETLRSNFTQRRTWPVLARPELLDRIVRRGSELGYWCVYYLTETNDKPDKIYGQEQGGVPMDAKLDDKGWGIVTVSGAKKRNWMAGAFSPAKVKDWAREAVIQQGAAKVADILESLKTGHGEVPVNAVLDALTSLAQDESIAFYVGEAEQDYKPELKLGGNTLLEKVEPDHSVITRAKAAERGWLQPSAKLGFKIDAGQSRAKLLPLLKRLGSVYVSDGGKSTIDFLDVYDLELPHGGRLRIQLEKAPAEDMKRLQEFFETLMSAAHVGPDTQGELDIKEPQVDCALINKLKNA